MIEMKELVDAIKNDRAMLFVGSGVSQNLRLPSWSELIERMVEQMGIEHSTFDTQSVDWLTVAEYYVLKKGSLGPLRSWMDVHWHSPDIDISTSQIHRLIVELNFPVIYTTNYDRWLERSYEYYKKDYIKIANVGDLINIRDGMTQIVKFHGDFDDDSSIVLTETSYFERMAFESHLDIKLRANC